MSGKGSRSVVTFRSTAFNTTEPKPYFINDCCFGDDLARWLIARLRDRGVQTDIDPGQEDFGWYFGYRTEEGAFTLVLGYRPDERSGDWIGTVERDCGFIAAVFGGRSRGITTTAIAIIHSVLEGATEVESVRWHHQSDFDAGIESNGVPEPHSD